MTVQRKQNLSSFDIAQLVKEYQSHIVTTRINAFNSCAKNVYMLKCAASQQALDSTNLPVKEYENLSKYKLVIQPGVRMNFTRYEQKISPPNEVSKVIRQKLINKIILGVQQFNFDRIVIMAIGVKTEILYYMIIELYGKGNLILTDQNMIIIICQNQFKNCKIGQCYNQSTQSFTFDKILSLSQQTISQFSAQLEQQFNAKGQQNQLRYVLASNYYIGGAAASIIIRKCNLTASVRCKVLTSQQTDEVYEYLIKLLQLLVKNNQQSLKQEMPGYIYFYQQNELNIDQQLLQDIDNNKKIIRSLQLAELYPVNLVEIFENLYQQQEIEQYITFNEAVDNYFSMLETCQQYQTQISFKNKQTNKELNIVNENQSRIDQLENEAKKLQLQAKLVVYNQQFIDQYIKLLNKQFEIGNITFSTISNQMQIQADKIFQYLESVDLITKVFYLRLPLTKQMYKDLDYNSYQEILNILNSKQQNEDDLELEEDTQENVNDADQDSLIINIPFQLTDTSGKIANQLYQKSTQFLQKADKTLSQQDAVLQKVKKFANSQDIQQEDLRILQKQTNLFWFEKFHWFVSSDGFLVVGGRDAQQNEILVKRFMGPNDLFVHADIHGASCVIVKQEVIQFDQNNEQLEIATKAPPEQTLREAAILSIVHSKAWEMKMIPQAYYVYKSQVSKTAPTGTYISTGSFVIRGKKNYIQVSSMYYGVGLLYRYEQYQDFFKLRQQSETMKQHLQEQYKLKDQQVQVDMQENDAQSNEKTITTKKVKQSRSTQEDAAKTAQKEVKKQEKKVRHLIIKQQKENAKMKRLEKEGKIQIIQKIQEQKQKVQEIDEKFCVVCQSLDHFYNDCEQYEQYLAIQQKRLPPIIANNIQQQVLESEDDSNSTCEQLEEESDQTVAVEEQQKQQQENLSRPMYYFSTTYIEDLNPACIFMIGPKSIFADFKQYHQITNGTIQRGQSYKQLQQLYQKNFENNQKIIQSIKNIPEHTVLISIPGSCQFTNQTK